jgi:hypothetical protein
MDDWGQQPFSQKSPSKTQGNFSVQNLAEAIKNSGGYAVAEAQKKAIKPVIKDFASALSGGAKPFPFPESQTNENPWQQEWLRQDNESEKRELHLRRHLEVQQQVYDRDKEETEKRIKELLEELRLLAKQIVNLDRSLQTAVQEEVVNPGTYHVNFFEKIRETLIFLRKKIDESQNWLEASYARRRKRSFSNSLSKGGTKFLLNQETYMTRAAG